MKRITSLLLLTVFLTGCGGSKAPQQASNAAPKATSPSESKAAAKDEAQPAAAQAASGDKQVVTYDQLLAGVDQLIAKNDVKNAVKVLSAAIKAKPNRSEAYIRRAAIFAENGLRKQAIGDMNSAIAIDVADLL